MKNIDLWHNKETEELLWSKLIAGDRKGLEGIYLRFSKVLFKYGLVIVPNQTFIQDCIQEIFIDLWNYHKGLKHTQNIKAYLFKTLSNKIFKELKKEKKEFVLFDESIKSSAYMASIESEIIDVQRNEDLKKKIATAINSLPARQKEILLYLFFENLSYQDVSDIMGINLKSAYTLAWKAISNIKKALHKASFF